MVVEALLARSDLPRSEALLLMAHASGMRREALIAASKEPLPANVARTFVALAERRAAGEPIAYLIGHREFYGRRFAVGPGVLIPRPETELLVDLALGWADTHRPAAGDTLRVLDLGTGSGAIAITLAVERPKLLAVTATDRSDASLAQAIVNAQALRADVRFLAGDWFAALDGPTTPGDPFDLIVSNPPYIAAGDRHLEVGDLRFEPSEALTDFADGLGALASIAREAPRHLRPGGSLMMEHGHDQAEAVRRLFTAAGFVDVRSARDLAGLERTTSGRLPGEPDGPRAADL